MICERYNVDPATVTYHIVNRSTTLAMDNYFRDAWKHDNGVVSVDMVKAVEVHKEKLRHRRADKLAKLDVDYMKADELGDNSSKAAIRNKKQALRDITSHPDITNATTPEQLKLAALSVLEV